MFALACLTASGILLVNNVSSAPSIASTQRRTKFKLVANSARRSRELHVWTLYRWSDPVVLHAVKSFWRTALNARRRHVNAHSSQPVTCVKSQQIARSKTECVKTLLRA
eukprot:PhF_6_TR38615/c0_g1_i1/m.57534